MSKKAEKISNDILKALGGKSNIMEAGHCATRLRIKVKSLAKVKKTILPQIDGVIDAIIAKQTQIVVGKNAPIIHNSLIKISGVKNVSLIKVESNDAANKKTTKRKTTKSNSKNIAFEMKGITKTFLNGTIVANDNVNIKVKKNTIHSICGGNGAGKSVLMSILFGLYKADFGTIFVNGKEVEINNPKEAEELGIGYVPQHPELVENLSVIENLTVGQEIDKNMFIGSRINKKETIKKFHEVNNRFKFNLNPKALVKDLPIAVKQKVQIMKSLWNDKKILILDEPTSILSPLEIESFLELISLFREFGRTVIFISHKLNEVLKISDEITILRNGKSIETMSNNSRVTEALLSKLIVGKTNFKLDTEKSKPTNKIKIEVNNLSTTKKDKNSLEVELSHINFNVKAGEIYGIAAIDGNGEIELLEALIGAKKHEGEIKIPELENEKSRFENFDSHPEILKTKQEIEKLKQELQNTNLENEDKKVIKHRIRAHKSFVNKYSKLNKFLYKFQNDVAKKINVISYLSPDRQDEGILMDANIVENGILDLNLKDPKYQAKGFVKWKQVLQRSKKIIADNDVKGAEDEYQIMRNLSGGNQQKFAIGRQLSREFEILILGQPTRGVDIGAINNIYKKVKTEANKGKAVIVQSYELNELLNHCNRIGIMHNGKLVTEFVPGKLSDTKISEYMLLGRAGK